MWFSSWRIHCAISRLISGAFTVPFIRGHSALSSSLVKLAYKCGVDRSPTISSRDDAGVVVEVNKIGRNLYNPWFPHKFHADGKADIFLVVAHIGLAQVNLLGGFIYLGDSVIL